MRHRFPDRRAAGRQLAGRLDRYAGRDDVLVLGLPRGGVPVAAEGAARLGAPLDVFVGRKLGVPRDDGLATGATMRAALAALRVERPAAIVAAAPVAPPGVREWLCGEADDVVCVVTP